jgi:hypothetical protein
MKKPVFNYSTDRDGKPFAFWTNPPHAGAGLSVEALQDLSKMFLRASFIAQVNLKGPS